MHDFGERRLQDALQLEAKFRAESTERRDDGHQVCGQTEQRMRGLVVVLADVVLVKEDASLGDCDENEGACLQDPVNSDAVVIV